MSTAVVCPFCRKDIDGSAKFCIYCGSRQRAGLSSVERSAMKRPRSREVIAFVVFGAIIAAILWSMYGRSGLQPTAPIARPTSVAPVPPKPAAPASPPPASSTARRNIDKNASVEIVDGVPPVTPGRKITYKAGGRHWSVLSGYQGDQIFYQKTIVRDGKTKTMTMRYPRSMKWKYERQNRIVARNFR